MVKEQGAGIDGSSFAAVQQWLHDFPAFDSMSRVDQDNIIGRHRDGNEEIENAPESAHVKRTAQENFDFEAFLVRCSMPWMMGEDAGLMSLAFDKSFDAYEAQLRRMTGGYYWCPPMAGNSVDLTALGVS